MKLTDGTERYLPTKINRQSTGSFPSRNLVRTTRATVKITEPMTVTEVGLTDLNRKVIGWCDYIELYGLAIEFRSTDTFTLEFRLTVD